MAVCPACKGQKKIWGAGMMNQHDCKHCKGLGRVDDPKIEVPSVDISSKESSVGSDVVVAVSDTIGGLAKVLEAKPKAKAKTTKSKK